MNANQIRDSSGPYFGLGIAVILAGVGLFGYFIATGVLHFASNLTQVVVPGEADMTLKGNQDYMIFAERQSVVNGRIINVSEDLNGLTCHVLDKATGAEVPLRGMHSMTTYNVNGRSGRSIMAFTPPVAGAYRFSCAYDEGKQGPQGVLAVAPNMGVDFVITVGKGLVSFFAGGVLGAILIVIAYRMRQRAKQQQAAQGSGPFV